MTYIFEEVAGIIYNKEATIAWIKRSNIDSSYYPLFILKMVMILILISLKTPNARLILDILMGPNNVSYLLPKTFVDHLLGTQFGCKMNPSVVAKAFESIEDPLVIVSLENSNPGIDDAIFVDLRKSKEEMMSILFPRKNKHICPCCSTTLPDIIVKPRMSWKFFDGICDFYDGKRDLSLIYAEIKKDLNKDIETLATVLEDGKSWAGDDTTLLQCALSNLKVLSEAFEMSQRKEVEFSVFIKSVAAGTGWLQSNMEEVDDFLSRYVMSQEWTFRNVSVSVSERSSTAQVEETGDKKNHDEEAGDTLPVEPVLEKQISGGSTQEAKNKKGKGKNKGNKGKKGKGKN